MTALSIAFAVVVLSMAAAAPRIIRGPSDADRAVGADVVFFSFVTLVAIIGIAAGVHWAVDLVLVCSLAGFLSAVSLARLVTGGKR